MSSIPLWAAQCLSIKSTMLRLRPTTLSLTMIEVEELEQRLKERKRHRYQFLSYLTRPGDASEIPEFIPSIASTSSAKARGKHAQTDQNTRFMPPSDKPQPEHSTDSEPSSSATTQRDQEITFTLPDRTRRVDTQREPGTKSDYPPEVDGQPPSPPQEPVQATPRRNTRAGYHVVDPSPSRSGDFFGPSSAPTPGAPTGQPLSHTREQSPARTPAPSSHRRTFRLPVEPAARPSSSADYAPVSTPANRNNAGTLDLFDGADRRENSSGPSLSPPRRPSTAAPRHRIRPRNPLTGEPTTPPPFEIYDDSLPSSSQPQTPQNLPEAQHQSRLRGSYTAPTRRGTSPGLGLQPWLRRRRREREGRIPSPPGLQTPGMMGLYGGLENTDDVTLFEHAIRRTMHHMDGNPGPST
ncbi:hypothetical protein QBC40DRAFT_270865 [Triangularia verruculosa]|uniref:Uncharacterized protein n=1 Tax=Triangularia verruculosa TaxID=2587418 RepID=A0AAN7B2C6_9PEZI|nr:hypothetical protein QBC40DRAFT_270865 [Triangularia verruculosa]